MQPHISFGWIFLVTVLMLTSKILLSSFAGKHIFHNTGFSNDGILKDIVYELGVFSSLFLAFCAFLEEVIFRFMPILICSVFSLFSRHQSFAIILLLAIQVVFGWRHGGWKHIFLQGVGGMLYALIYFLPSGLRAPDLVFGLMIGVLTHALWNIGILYEWWRPIRLRVDKYMI